MMEEKLKGVKMELDDCAFPLLASTEVTSSLSDGFRDVDIAMLVGSKPRGPGMERGDLLVQNGKIFVDTGKALNDMAKRDVKVLVVGNPANTNCLIAMKNAPNLPSTNFHAMTRLDHNRAVAQVRKYYLNYFFSLPKRLTNPLTPFQTWVSGVTTLPPCSPISTTPQSMERKPSNSKVLHKPGTKKSSSQVFNKEEPLLLKLEELVQPPVLPTPLLIMLETGS
jgi:hypothetical protein